MRDFWRRLGTPDAINWLSVVSVWVLAGFGPLLAAGADYDGRVIVFVAAVSAGLAASMPVLLVGKLVLRRAHSAWAPVFTIAAFELTILVRVVVFDHLLVQWGFIEEPHLAWRFLTSQATMLFGLLAAAYVVPAAREYSRSRRALDAQLELLTDLRNDAAGRIERNRIETVGRIQTALARALDLSQPTDPGATSSRLQLAIDEVVRPLSLQITSAMPIEMPERPASGRIRWGDVTQHALNGRAFYPLLSSVWLLIATGGTWLPQYGALALGAAGVCAAVTYGLTLLAASVWRRLPPAFGPTTRSLLLSVGLAGIGIAVIRVGGAMGINLLSPGPAIGGTAVCIAIGWVFALCAGAIEAMRSSERAQASLEDELRREVAALNGANRQAQLRLSRLLHGPIQDSIAAALRKVDNGAPARDIPALVAELNLQINAALSTDAPPAQLADFGRAMSDIQTLWDGVCRIDLEISDTDLSMIGADQIATGALIELARESCSNAIRHGTSTQCLVEVSVDRPDAVIRLRVTSNGSAPSPDAVPGQGSALFQELSIDWSRTAAPPGCLVEASIPLDLG